MENLWEISKKEEKGMKGGKKGDARVGKSGEARKPEPRCRFEGYPGEVYQTTRSLPKPCRTIGSPHSPVSRLDAVSIRGGIERRQGPEERGQEKKRAQERKRG